MIKFIDENFPLELAIPEPKEGQFFVLSMEINGEKAKILSNNEMELCKFYLKHRAVSSEITEPNIALNLKRKLNHAPLVPSVFNQIKVCPPASLLMNPHTTNGEGGELIFKSAFVEGTTKADDFSDFLIQEYANAMEGKNEVHLFISAGYDSRLELALIIAASGGRIALVLHSFYENECTSAIIRQIARSVSSDLIFHEMRDMTDEGMSNTTILNSMLESSSWRPTIPAYSQVVINALKHSEDGSLKTSIFFGFTPFELKGRYQNMISQNRGQRLRYLLSGTSETHSLEIRMQEELFRIYEKSNPFTSISSEIDFLNWSISFTNSYSHRIRILQQFGLNCPLAGFDVAQRFFNLPEDEKYDVTFIVRALEILNPRLLQIDFLSSSGDGMKKNKPGLNKKNNAYMKPVVDYLIQQINESNEIELKESEKDFSQLFTNYFIMKAKYTDI